MRSLVFVPVAVAVLLAGVGCGGQGRSTTTSVASAASPPQRPDPVKRSIRVPAAVRVTRTAYGPALSDRRGFALYRFTRDRSNASTCYGACAAAWPPYVVAKPPSDVGPGAHRGLLGSVRRRDGRLQVTYAGRPLYYYIGDRRSGQVLCQAVTEFGGTWYVVASDGHPIR